jgi:hypothetical protein
LSIELRRTETVYSVIQELFSNGRTSVRPGDVNAVLRERDAPMGTWEVRAEFSRLESDGRLACNEDTGNWYLTENASLQDAAG